MKKYMIILSKSKEFFDSCLLIMLLGFSVTTAFESCSQPVCFKIGQDIYRSNNINHRCKISFANKEVPCSWGLVQRKSRLHQHPPPGSGYLGAEDEKCYLPDTYEPTMEYPGTLRPGRTRENISFQDLPIGDDDPDPIPWPHFQEIDFYHIWPAPHPDPKPINDMIAEYGRWATPEEEAEMMRDARRGVRLMKEMQEAEKKSFVLVDDDDDEAAEEVEDGSDVIESGVREQTTGRQTTAKPSGKKQKGVDTIVEGEDETIDFSELNFDDSGDEVDDDDDFLFDLGLDGEEADEDIIVDDIANIDKSKSIGASEESIAPMDDVLDTDVLDDVVPTDVLNDIEDAETVLGINTFEDDEDDYYVGREEDDYGDLDAYDDNEGVY